MRKLNFHRKECMFKFLKSRLPFLGTKPKPKLKTPKPKQNKKQKIKPKPKPKPNSK